MTIIESLPWFAWIPIVAIVCGTASGIVKMWITHKERVAMIQQGMHPDVPTAKAYDQAEL